MAAVIPVVTCPECEKKFKPKADVSGKKIKCPFCAEPFVVPGEKQMKGGPDKAAAGKGGKSEQTKADAQAKEPPAPAKAPIGEFDADPDPYGVKNVELVPRCPNCTMEMGPHDTICLSCGYNTMTRVWGKTEKTIGLTGSRRIVHLLPAIGSAIFVFFSVISLLFFYTVLPYLVVDTKADLLDSEAMRMWTTLAFFFIFWMAGTFCFKKFIEKPKPDEIKID